MKNVAIKSCTAISPISKSELQIKWKDNCSQPERVGLQSTLARNIADITIRMSRNSK